VGDSIGVARMVWAVGAKPDNQILPLSEFMGKSIPILFCKHSGVPETTVKRSPHQYLVQAAKARLLRILANIAFSTATNQAEGLTGKRGNSRVSAQPGCWRSSQSGW
jgi:hypothetical protein